MCSNIQTILVIGILMLAGCASERPESKPLGFRSAVVRSQAPTGRAVRLDKEAGSEPVYQAESAAIPRRPAKARKPDAESVIYERHVESTWPAESSSGRKATPVAADSRQDSARKEVEARYQELLKLGFITKEQYDAAMKGEKR